MKKILVVNNDIDTMSLLKGWLERKKYKVKFTGDQDKVPGLVKDFSPDIVLVDVLQHKVAENLKSDNKTKGIPVIVMTGYTLKDQNKFLLAADEVIEKPFDPKYLEDKIKSLLNGTK